MRNQEPLSIYIQHEALIWIQNKKSVNSAFVYGTELIKISIYTLFTKIYVNKLSYWYMLNCPKTASLMCSVPEIYAMHKNFNVYLLRPNDAYMHGELTIIVSDNGLLPGRHKAIIWTNTGILLVGPLRTNISEFLIAILKFSFTKMHFKVF